MEATKIGNAEIRIDFDDYNKRRVNALSDVLITFFKRHPNKFYTRFCFKERLDGFEPGQRKEMLKTCTDINHWRQEMNSDWDIHIKWAELDPTDLEEKMVWSALERAGFLRKSRNENYDPNLRNPSGIELSAVAPEGNRWLWMHVPEIPEHLANWTW